MVRPKPVYDYLFDYATPKQQEYLKAVQEHGSALQAAKAIGVYQSSISRAYDVVAAKAAKSAAITAAKTARQTAVDAARAQFLATTGHEAPRHLRPSLPKK